MKKARANNPGFLYREANATTDQMNLKKGVEYLEK